MLGCIDMDLKTLLKLKIFYNQDRSVCTKQIALFIDIGMLELTYQTKPSGMIP